MVVSAAGLEPGSPKWWAKRHRAHARRKPRIDGLTLERIASTALTIVDREGLAALTMRRLADDLHAGHASLYRHFASREELLVEVVDHMLGEIRAPLPGLAWREHGEQLARELRRVLLKHSALMPALTNAQLIGPNAMRGRELALKPLVNLGVELRFAAYFYLVIVHFVICTVLLDASGTRTKAQRKAMTDLFKVVGDEYPTVKLLADVLNESDPELEFNLGLEALLDGIQIRLKL